ncbi:MAG: septal ring lytic transglycosylase RlpA family protein [Pontixanthobacter sp.]
MQTRTDISSAFRAPSVQARTTAKGDVCAAFINRALGALALVALIPVPIASFAMGDDTAAASDVAFEDKFERFDDLPPMPQAEGNVVDITEFTPPIEAAPEPEPVATRAIAGGVASYYGRRFQGRRTANGERFDMNALTAAHKTLPFGTKVAVTNPRNGKTVTVRINDRGPYAHGRTIDLSRAAAKQIGIVQRGHGKVELALLN